MSRNVRYSLIILTLVLVWLLSGVLFEGDEESTDSASDQTQVLPSVQVQDIAPQRYTPVLAVNARTEAYRAVDLKAETGGQLLDTPVEEGEPVKAGEVLGLLKVDDRKARLTEAETALQQAILDYDGTVQLMEQNLVSDIQVARAKTTVDSARANMEFRKLELARTRLRAPFDGVLNKRAVEAGAYLQPGQVFAEVLQLDPIKAVAQVSGEEVLSLKKGAPVRLVLNNDIVLAGELVFVSARAEDATRAFTIEARFENPDNQVPADLTGRLEVQRVPGLAYPIPASIVSLDGDGQMVAKAVDEDSKVYDIPVQVVDDNPSNLWVTGPDGPVRFIVVGQEYVVSGETVETALAGGGAALDREAAQ